MNDVPRGLLRDTLRCRMTPGPSAGCIDSQTLAAWSDGALNAREREAVEAHASECAQCQALLAAMVRSAPPALPSRWWRPSTFGWLAPLAAAAAAILLWINLPGSTQRSTTDAVTPSVAPAAGSSVVVPPPSSAVVPPPSASPSSPPPQVADRAVGSRTPTRARAATAPPQSAASLPVPPAIAEAAAIAQKKEAPQTAEPSSATKGAPAETRDMLSVPPLPPPSAAPVAAKSDAPAPTAVASAEPRMRSKLDATAPLDMIKAVGPIDIGSPDASVRWRIFPPPGGRVARSIDGGATWQVQSANVTVALTAGAAPAATVCWLVGAGGTVVLSTDGRTWQRVPFPETIDLVAVRASDAANASVTTADGRTFSTSDGGKIWRQP
jgi:hypothetical protein